MTKTKTPDKKAPAIVLKYNIKERLDNLPYSERNQKIQELCDYLNVSTRTLSRWWMIPLDSEQDIPAESFLRIAKWFGLEEEKELVNYEVPETPGTE